MCVRFIIASNRLPLSVSRKDKDFVFKKSVGGLATGVGSVYRKTGGVWIGWPGVSLESLRGKDKGVLQERLKEEGYYPVFLSQREISGYYHGYSNKVLWPLFHYFSNYVVFDNGEMWKQYVKVNEKFADAIVANYKDGDIIWVHDYHLMLVPSLVRQAIPNAAIGFFLHIPFPSYELFRLLPQRKELLEGLLGADLIGFHTYDYVRHFLSSVRRILGIDHQMGYLWVGRRRIKVDAFPMGIDTDRFRALADSKGTVERIKKLEKRLEGRKLILSVDRLDYTKGIDLRLQAFEYLLSRYPSLRKELVLAMIVVPSRSQVETYQKMKRRIDEMVGRINSRFGSWGRMPVWYMYTSMPQEDLVPLYKLADVALVTPIRDGMNLVAKEYVAVKGGTGGMLVLSEMAGAAAELGEAILVNPMDIQGVAQGILSAIKMPRREKKRRMEIMYRRVKKWNVHRWAHDFIDRLQAVKAEQREFEGKMLTQEIARQIKSDFTSAVRPVFLLDWDGTLTPIVRRPEYAAPDKEALKLLKELSGKAEVVIVSGRDRRTLTEWFGHLPISLIAEHGAWIKKKDGDWEPLVPLNADWKDEVRAIMELYADRTPGSFVEEKEYSIAWHYRMAVPEQAAVMSAELKDVLLSLASGKNLEVLEGNKVIEVRVAGVNKGVACSTFIKGADFILAAGDDWTDEDIFRVLPPSGWSIKVGPKPSVARLFVETPYDMRALLWFLLGKRKSLDTGRRV